MLAGYKLSLRDCGYLAVPGGVGDRREFVSVWAIVVTG